MKTKTIKVEVPDFCPEDCTEFELAKDVFESPTESIIFFRCKHEGFCNRTHEHGGEPGCG